MDKKKVIGIVVFIVLGLVIFTFANPAPSTLDPVDEPGQEDKQPDKDKQQEEDKEDEKDDSETVGNIEDDEEKDESVVDYYQLALEAVIKAEGSLVQDDIDAAKDLINNVNEDLKEDLVNRVENVQNVVDYNKLLTELENKVNSSTNKDELNSARDYNTTNELANKLASLNDDANKEKLLNRYNVLLPKLNDTTAPVVSGVLNDSYVNDLVSLTISDDASFIATLNDENYITGTEIKEDGTYILVAVDSSFNETVVTFTIDTIKPVFTGIQNGHQYKEVTLGLTEKNIAEVVIYNRDLDKYYDFYEGMVLTDEGTYTAYAKDKAGNLSGTREDGIIYFAIDNTKPEVIDITQVYEEKEDGRIKVTIKTSEEIFGDLLGSSKWRKVEGKNEYFNYYYNTKEVTINFFDKARNEGTYTFVVDKTAPTAEITMSNNNGNTSTNKDVTVTLTASEDILDIEGWTKVDSKTFTKVFSENGKYSVEITDLVGNKSTINFEVKRIDKVAPVVTINGKTDTYVEFGSEYKELGATMTDNVDATITNLQPTKINLYDLNGKFIKDVTKTGVNTNVEGKYLLYYDYEDGAGNSSKTDNGYTPYQAKRWVIVQDTKAPEITGVASNTTYFGSIDYNMSDDNGIKYIYYDFTHNYQSCEELINAYNNKVGGVGREDVKGLVNYAGNYPIPAGYAFKGVSYCAVDNGYYENKTFMNNISVYADTSAETILEAVSENNGTIILPKAETINLTEDLVINSNTTIVGNGATLVGKVIISGDNVVLKNIKLTDNLVVTGANAVLDGVTMLNVNSAGTGKGNGYQVIKVNTNGNFTMKNSIIDNTYSNGSFYNAINISAEGKVEIEDNKFINIENVYNIIEFSQSTPIASGTIIKGNEFIGKSKNNVISMFLFEDENVITIEDNYFEFSGNALRISNYSNAKNVVINVNGNKYNDTLGGEYAGFMFFQEVKNESFAGITINVTNLIGPDGVKITSETTGKYLFNYYYSDHQSLTKEDYATINFLD